MNKHILLVMKWLNDKNLVSQEELERNADAAADAADAAYAAYTATYDSADADFWVDEYFQRSGEDKQDYINEIKKDNKQ